MKPRFCFKVEDDIINRYINQSIGKKWRDFRLKLWNEFYDPTLSIDDIINNVPKGFSIDQWATFVDYRLRPDTQVFSSYILNNYLKIVIVTSQKPNIFLLVGALQEKSSYPKKTNHSSH